ncbi:MAG: putative sulfate exporter family transporter [Planctomycetes bacterium]|nr:putative sulfate exporter family transporter [Planctomycetota bacterium]
MSGTPNILAAQARPAGISRLAGWVVLLALAAMAKLSHLVVPQLPAVVWALLYGVLAGATQARSGLRSLPYEGPLTVGITLMGTQVQLEVLRALGWHSLASLLLPVLVLAALLWAAVAAGLLPRRLAGLFGLGLFGFGVSALAAAAQRDSKSGGTPLVLATAAVLLTGALALLVLPLAGAWLGLDAAQFGLLAGSGIANNAEALATGAAHSPQALVLTGALKVAVNAFEGLAVVGYVWWFGRPSSRASGPLPRLSLPALPAYVPGFVVAAGLSLAGWISAAERQSLGNLTNWAFFLALVGVGFRTRLDVLRRVGGRPVLVGIVAWLAATAALVGWIWISRDWRA